MNDMWIVDATVCFHLEGGDKQNLTMHRSLIGRLKHRGFSVGKNPTIEKNYPSLSRTHYYGRHGALEFTSESYSTGMRFEFFQNIKFENPNGGQYDFNRASKMPYLVRMRWLWTVNVIKDWCKEKEISVKPENPCPFKEPLADFNERWNGEYEKHHNINRFERGMDGWPTEKELGSWARFDAEGNRINQGDTKYLIMNGRWMRGVVHGGINGMWLFKTKDKLRQVNGNTLRSTFPGRGRFFPDAEKRMHAACDRAAKNKEYLLAHRIQQAIKRLNSTVSQ